MMYINKKTVEMYELIDIIPIVHIYVLRNFKTKKLLRIKEPRFVKEFIKLELE